MTQSKNKEINEIMSQMDLNLQKYAIDMIRHLKSAQDILQKNDTLNKSRAISQR